jgi:hypothetical protein
MENCRRGVATNWYAGQVVTMVCARRIGFEDGGARRAVVALVALVLVFTAVIPATAHRTACGPQGDECQRLAISACCCKLPAGAASQTDLDRIDVRPSASPALFVSTLRPPIHEPAPRPSAPLAGSRATTPLTILFSTFLI